MRHIIKDRANIVRDRAQRIVGALSIHLKMHHRLDHGIGGGLVAELAREHTEGMPLAIAHDTHDRVNQQVNGQAAAIQRHTHGIDQKGHVVTNDVDDGMG